MATPTGYTKRKDRDMNLAELIKAERAAADLAYYFGSSDLHEKYEAAQAATDDAADPEALTYADVVEARDALASRVAEIRNEINGIGQRIETLNVLISGFEWYLTDYQRRSGASDTTRASD